SRRAAAQHGAGGANFQHSRVPQVFAQQFKYFARPWLQNLAYHALRDQMRRAISYRRDLDFVAFWNQRYGRISVEFFDLFRLGQWCAQSDRKVASEVVSTDG